jgi:hypothetical protein
MSNNYNQRLNGQNVLSYIGSNPIQPTNFTTSTIDPNSYDATGFNLGDWWLNVSDNSIWYLASTDGLSAVWIEVESLSIGLLGLTGNSGGEVFPLSGNINVIGDVSTISISGDPITSTLTVSALRLTEPLTLTGNSGGAVGPTSGNINIIGSGDISVTGDIATSTLTINESPDVAVSFLTQSGTAVPSSNIININGSNGLTTTGSGSTITIVAEGTIAQSFITNPATSTAIPVVGELTFAGAGGTTISASGSTVTITGGSALPSYSAGTFTPFLAIGGSSSGITYTDRGGNYNQMGNLVAIQILLDLAYPVSGSGNVTIGGLPFVVSNAYGPFLMETSVISSSNYMPTYPPSNAAYIWGRYTPGTTEMALLAQVLNLSTTVPRAFVGTDIETGFAAFAPRIFIQGFYFI